VVGLGNVLEAGGQHGGHASTNHAVEAEGEEGKVAPHLAPVERIIGRVLWLWLQDEAAIFRPLLLQRAS